MKRKIMVVTAAYGYDQVHAAGGQTAMLPIIAEAGADGVEIRREMLSDAELKTLPTLASAIEIFGLLACYSAPEPLFLQDGHLNPHLPALLQEAQTLQALWLKVSLGHFSHTQQFDTLREWLNDSGMELVVENDQTSCGRLQPMLHFRDACQKPVTGQVEFCAKFLEEYCWYRSSYKSLVDSLGQVYAVIGYTVNIQEEVMDRDKLVESAQRDSLTKLYNREMTENLVNDRLVHLEPGE